jgi:solute:Na+ symporter, SSS family
VKRNARGVAVALLIVAGFVPLVYLGLKGLSGWPGLSARLAHVATSQGFAPQAWSSTGRELGHSATNPMGIEWFGVLMGLGFVLSFG